LAQLNALGNLAEVPKGFAIELAQALKQRNDTLEAKEQAVAHEQQAISTCAAITIDERLLSRSEEIVHLFSQMGACAKAQADLPAVERQVEKFSNELSELALRLGFPHSLAIEKARPSDATLALVRTLIAEGRQIASALSNAASHFADENEALVELQKQARSLSASVDPKPLRERFAALLPMLRQFEIRDDIARKIANLTRQLDEMASRFSPPLPDEIASLAMAKLPSSETVARFRKSLDTLDKDGNRLKDRFTDTSASVSAIEQRVRSFTVVRPVPSPDAILIQRQKRDTLWFRLRSTLFGSDRLSGPVLEQCASEFERDSTEADRLADEALADASRVAEYGIAQRQLMDEQRKVQGLHDALADIEERRGNEWSAYSALWEVVGVESPLPPAELIVWLESVRKLLEKREELEETRVAYNAAESAIQKVIPVLLQLANDSGLAGLADLGPALVAPLLENRLRDLAEAWNMRRELDASIHKAKERIDRLVARQKKLEDQNKDWLKRWRQALAAISLPEATIIEQAQAALETWQLVPATLNERDDRAFRVAGMKQDLESFARQANALIADVAPYLAPLSPDAAVKRLNERLNAASSAIARRTEAEKRVREAVRNRESAVVKSKAAETAIQELAKQLPPDSDLVLLCDRLKRRDELATSLAKLRNQLISQAEGHDETLLRNQLTSFDPDSATGTLNKLEIEEEQLDGQAKEAFAAHKQALDEREALEQRMGAEVAAIQLRSAEVELAAAAHEWSVLRLGSLMLSTAIERLRSSQQDPLMTRASQLFAAVTGGSFQGLGQEFDDDGVPRLIGRRANDRHVQVTGMSEGARDQLYLALRLAYLEDYATRAEPIPFIGDDLFITFDEDRTKHSLAALATIGDGVQSIIFTHHRHVVELAQQAVGEGLDVLEFV
jgi:uncharacterized protein YhaN